MEAFFRPEQADTKHVPLPYLSLFRHSLAPTNERFLSLSGVWRYDSPHAPLNSPAALDSLNDVDRASCLQAWLFFGLISQFFGRQVESRNFVLRDAANREIVVVTHAHLLGLFRDWKSDFAAEPYVRRMAILNERLDFLRSVLFMCDRVDIVRTREITADQYWLADVLLSVRLLLSALYAFTERESLQTPEGSDSSIALRAIQNVYNPHPKTDAENLIQVRMNSSKDLLMIPLHPGSSETFSYKALKWRFEAHGWCPIRCQQLSQTLDYSMLIYLSTTRQSPWSSPNAHSQCSRQGVCTAYNVSDEHYQQAHFGPLCDKTSCKQVASPIQDVSDYIEAGKIPLIGLDLRSPDLSPKWTYSNGSKQFAAISHVWSDGLGNPTANSLPLCQLRRIAILLSKAEEQETPKKYKNGKRKKRIFDSKRLYFWMDTLCIPVRDRSNPKSGQTKKKALQYITAIFEAADRTIVLDSNLYDVKGGLGNREKLQWEVNCRILGGKWIQRAWTLEEGGLSRSCYFSYRTQEVISLSALTSDGLEDEGNRKGVWTRIFRRSKYMPVQDTASLSYRGSPLRDFVAKLLNEQRKKVVEKKLKRSERKKYLSTPEEQFVNSWNQLLERTATKPDDLTYIFASLLDLNATELANMDRDSRFPQIIRSIPKFPLSLLFNTKGNPNTIAEHYDSWVPLVLGGDRLGPTGFLTWHKNNTTEDFHVRLELGDPASPKIWVIKLDNLVPWDTSLFLIEGTSEGELEKFVVDIPASVWETEYGAGLRQRAQESYYKGDSTYLIIDWGLGSDLRNGYSARGARFSHQNGALCEISGPLLDYDRPITVWQLEQWRLKTGFLDLPEKAYRYRRILPSPSLCLRHSLLSKTTPSTQRPLYRVPSRKYPVIRAILIFVVVGGLTLLMTAVVSPVKCSTSKGDGDRLCNALLGLMGGLFFTLPVIFFLLYSLVHFYIRKRSFNSWLESFKTNRRPKRLWW